MKTATDKAAMRAKRKQANVRFKLACAQLEIARDLPADAPNRTERWDAAYAEINASLKECASLGLY